MKQVVRRGGHRARLFAVLAGFFAASALPASADAALPNLILTKTNPASPSASSLPRIKGAVDEGGGAAKVVHSPVLSGLFPPRTSLSPEPGNTVRIYTASSCLGPTAAEGTVGGLEGEGILVGAPVAADAITTFYAVQSNGSEESHCSAGLAFRQVSSAPSAPVFSAVAPASPANDNAPLLIGSADPEANVSIYPTSDCTGTPFGGSGTEFATPGIAASVADNSETTFSAIAVLAGFSSPCSTVPISYREITPASSGGGSSGGSGGGGGTGGGAGATGGGATSGAGGGTAAPSRTPPQAPRIHTSPSGTSNDTTPLIAGSAPDGTSVMVSASGDCTGTPVAKGSASQLGSGFQVQVVENIVTTFSAVAVSGSGQSSCSSSVQYVEDSTPPRSRITMGPAAKTRHRAVVLRFTDTTGDSPGTAFACKVDKRKWQPCSSPLKLRRLHLSKHTVKVKATDPAGNAELRPAVRTFKVVAGT
jgi:hypothetical protein